MKSAHSEKLKEVINDSLEYFRNKVEAEHDFVIAKDFYARILNNAMKLAD